MTRLSRLAADARGASLSEFAILLPVMMMLVMGASEMAYQAYLQAMIEGALQQAARKSTIQGGAENAGTFDDQVKAIVKRLNRRATVSFDRQNYQSFLALAPERYDDKNDNKKRDPGECFDDINKNKTWDAKPGMTGQGGANDVTAYTVVVDYPRLFPIGRMIGWGTMAQIDFTTYLKNQPFATQAGRTVTQVCT